MLVYGRGCSGAFLGACLAYLMYNHLQFGNAFRYFALVLMMIPFILLAGFFGFGLWKLLQSKQKGVWIGLLSFLALGHVYSLAIHGFFSFNWGFHLAILAGSLCFFLAQLVANRVVSQLIALSGPLVALVIGFAYR
ncbi:hypothetical protein ACAF76_015065 [Brevibacillus sp. TJ4]|uniref:hypothetical protein n=1 Tax=Brevibacillus sp. TJ4 TaxID=3234853 RepID=UPI0037D29EA0